MHTRDQHVTAIHSTFKISLVHRCKRIHILYNHITISTALHSKVYKAVPRSRVRGDRSGLRKTEHARGGPCPTLP